MRTYKHLHYPAVTPSSPGCQKIKKFNLILRCLIHFITFYLLNLLPVSKEFDCDLNIELQKHVSFLIIHSKKLQIFLNQVDVIKQGC